ncbi:MAG: hypothetical protein IT283_03700 [Bacteroidetes bacterium]|nr:hypothetical protein [Bacteroidota bacterium]
MTDFTFTASDIEKISSVLGNASGNDGNAWTWKLSNPQTRQAQVVSLHNNISFGPNGTGSLVVVQTIHGYFELHSCSGYVLFEPDEVIFVSAMGDFLSGMVVGRQCVCSMFAPIRRKTLSMDLTELDPAILMSAMQLSLAEAVL